MATTFRQAISSEYYFVLFLMINYYFLKVTLIFMDNFLVFFFLEIRFDFFLDNFGAVRRTWKIKESNMTDPRKPPFEKVT